MLCGHNGGAQRRGMCIIPSQISDLGEKCMAAKKNIPPYDPTLRTLARALRKSSTLGEVLLWRAIKRRALGCEFHRQVPIDAYIVDFFCHEHMLAIEIDGGTHDHVEAFQEDMKRQERLESLGVRFLRFREGDVRENLAGVV